MTGQELFSYQRRITHLQRAQRIAASGADFLAKHAANEICSRIAVTNRTFGRVLDLFSPASAMADALRTTLPQAEIVTLSELSGANRDNLALPAHSFDLAVSAFGLHWCNDLPGTLIQLRAALKPDAMLLIALPGEGTLGQLRQVLLRVETRLLQGASMRIDPFVEVRQAGALLQRAGYALPVADAELLTLGYANVAAMVGEMRAMAATTALAGRRAALPKSVLHEIEAEYRQSFGAQDGRIPVSVNIVYMTGWSPHESQQQPLRPGSAKARLSDFLQPPKTGDKP